MRLRTQLISAVFAVLVVGWSVSTFDQREQNAAPRPQIAVPVRTSFRSLPRPRPRMLRLEAGVPETQLPDRVFLIAADTFIRSQASDRQLRDIHQLRGSVVRTPFGATVSYQVFQGELPILGMRIEVKFDRQMSVSASQWNYRPIDFVNGDSVNRDSANGDSLRDDSVVSQAPRTREEIGEISNRMPAGFTVRWDGSVFSEVIYENFNENRGEFAIAVPATNSLGMPVTVLIRASDGALLGVEMPRSER